MPVVNGVKGNPQDFALVAISGVRDMIATFQRTYDSLIDLRPVCRYSNAGLLRLGISEPVVHSRVCRSLPAGLGVWIYAGGVAIWIG